GRDVLHEDTGLARVAVPGRGELVAHVQRGREVVARVDHQPVAEPVDALVGQEARLADVRVLADVTGALDEVGARGADEGALDDAVVVTRPARGAALPGAL